MSGRAAKRIPADAHTVTDKPGRDMLMAPFSNNSFIWLSGRSRGKSGGRGMGCVVVVLRGRVGRGEVIRQQARLSVGAWGQGRAAQRQSHASRGWGRGPFSLFALFVALLREWLESKP